MSEIHEILIISLPFLLTRMFLVKGHQSEESYHINMSKFLRSGRMKINGVNDIFIPKGRFSNPILYHYILSFLPGKFICSKGLRIINCIFDYTTALFFYFYIDLLNLSKSVTFLGKSFEINFIVAFWLVLSPALLPLNSRTRGGGARTMGLLLSSIYFISLYEYSISGNISYGIICVIGMFLLLFSGQFGHQVAIFSTILIAIITLNFNILVPLIFYALVSFLVSSNLWIFFWCKFLAHFRFYTSVMAGTLVGDRYSDPLNLPFDKKSFRFDKKKLRKFIYLSPLYFMPAVYALNIIAIYLMFNSAEIPSFIEFSLTINLCLTIVGFITFWYPFSVFGQSERYLEFATPFALIPIILFSHDSVILSLIFAFNLIVSIFHLYLLNKRKVPNTSKLLSKHDELYLNSIGSYNMLVCPYKKTFDCFHLAELDKNYFVPLINKNRSANWDTNFNLFIRYGDYYPDWKRWKEEYKVTHLMVLKEHRDIDCSKYDNIQLLSELSNFYLYKI